MNQLELSKTQMKKPKGSKEIRSYNNMKNLELSNLSKKQLIEIIKKSQCVKKEKGIEKKKFERIMKKLKLEKVRVDKRRLRIIKNLKIEKDKMNNKKIRILKKEIVKQNKMRKKLLRIKKKDLKHLEKIKKKIIRENRKNELLALKLENKNKLNQIKRLFKPHKKQEKRVQKMMEYFKVPFNQNKITKDEKIIKKRILNEGKEINKLVKKQLLFKNKMDLVEKTQYIKEKAQRVIQNIKEKAQRVIQKVKQQKPKLDPEQKVLHFPKEVVDLFDMRISELKLASIHVKKKNEKSFLKLYKIRTAKKHLNKKKTVKISLTLDVTILAPLGTVDQYEGYESNVHRGIKDEYNVKNKYVRYQHQFGAQPTLLAAMDSLPGTEKTYGPFHVRMLKKFENRDEQNKYFMSVLLSKKFSRISSEFIHKLGARIVYLKKMDIKKHKMGGVKDSSENLESYLIKTHNNYEIKKCDDNNCVLNYIWHEIKNKKGFKKYDYEKLKNEIYCYVENPPMISTEEIIDWLKCENHTNISVHAYDPRFQKFYSHTNNCSNVVLCYQVKDFHLFPILNKQLKEIAIKSNCGGAKKFIDLYDRFKMEQFLY